MIEVEAYRVLAERAALGRPISAVETPDQWYLKAGLVPPALEVLVGSQLSVARRRGKLLLLGTRGPDGAAGPVLGLRFGMSGRLVVDGAAGVAELRHSTNEPLARYDRFGLVFSDGGHLRVRDPRRLGGVQLDPAEAPTPPPSPPGSWVPPWPAAGRRSRPGSWTSPAWRAWATSSPTRSCGEPACPPCAWQAAYRRRNCGGFTATSERL
jgi:hypothetical protein